MRDRKKIKIQWHVLVLTFSICCFSLLCWFGAARKVASNIYHSYFQHKNLSNTETGFDIKTAESSEPSHLLTLFLDKIDTPIKTFDSTWYEAMYHKADISKIDSGYTYYLTHELNSQQVIMGKDDWLFYKGFVDCDTIADYEGTNILSESQMTNILTEVKKVQDNLEQQNIKFGILIAPSKESIYPEYMPDQYHHGIVSRSDILTGYLQENNVPIVFPKESLYSKKSQYPLFYKYDSHWNRLGAYVGTCDILTKFGIQMPDLSEKDINSYNLAGMYHPSAEDDLAQMVGLREKIFTDEIEYLIKDSESLNYWIGKGQNGEVDNFQNDAAANKGSVLLVADSMGVAMIPALSEYYTNVYVIHRRFPLPDMLETLHPDAIIIEICERDSSKLIELPTILQ